MISNNKSEIFAIIRHLAGALGAVILGQGLIDESGVAELTGAVTTASAVIWSIVEKKAQKKKKSNEK